MHNLYNGLYTVCGFQKIHSDCETALIYMFFTKKNYTSNKIL